MRKPAVIIPFFAFLFSCSPDQPANGAHTDSVKDSAANTTVNTVDTAHRDSAQTSIAKNDCSVLRRRIPDEKKQQEQIKSDLEELARCSIDSFDFIYVVPNLFPGWVSENHVQGFDTVTYGDFLNHLKEFKTTTAYVQLHERVNTLDSLKSTPYEPKKLYAMKPVLGKLGFTEPEWEMFYGFAGTYPIPAKRTFTWGDMLDAFDKYKPKDTDGH